MMRLSSSAQSTYRATRDQQPGVLHHLLDLGGPDASAVLGLPARVAVPRERHRHRAGKRRRCRGMIQCVRRQSVRTSTDCKCQPPEAGPGRRGYGSTVCPCVRGGARPRGGIPAVPCTDAHVKPSAAKNGAMCWYHCACAAVPWRKTTDGAAAAIAAAAAVSSASAELEADTGADDSVAGG